jgi:rhodanese-related sulfurtransferase
MTGARFIAPSELERIMPSLESGECVLLDIRTAAEFGSGHIQYARLMPVGELENRIGEIDRGSKLVIYCRSGKRCLAALPLLSREGHGEVLILEGGVERWPGGLVND